MLFLALLQFSLSITYAVSFPSLYNRQTSSACVGLGHGASDSLPYNFSLAAYYLDGSNSNSTGVPLVLGWGPAGSDPDASEWAISTYASWGSNEWPYISLERGALYPRPGPDQEGLGAYNFNTSSGDEVIFFVTIKESSPPVADIWCAVTEGPGADYEMLAVHGDPNSFALCAATTNWVFPDTQFNLVYAPSPDNDGVYSDPSCFAVRVQIVPYVD